MTGISTEDIIADLVAIAPTALASPELVARMEAFRAVHGEDLTSFRVSTLAFVVEWIMAGEELGADREVLDRWVAQELTAAAALVIGSMKRRLGEVPSPARFALVAYEIYRIVGDAFKTGEQAAATASGVSE